MANTIDHRGIKVVTSLAVCDLFELEPQFFQEFCKVIVDLDSGEVVVGMMVHKNGKSIIDGGESTYGANVFKDGSIVYESTLNVPFNLKNGTASDDIRIITNEEMQSRIFEKLSNKIVGLKR